MVEGLFELFKFVFFFSCLVGRIEYIYVKCIFYMFLLYFKKLVVYSSIIYNNVVELF